MQIIETRSRASLTLPVAGVTVAAARRSFEHVAAFLLAVAVWALVAYLALTAL